MAEIGAHLLTSNQERPSIFETVAADSLHATFHPALKKIADYFGTCNPGKFAFLVKYYDEIFFLVNGVIQNYYLTKKNGSLSEVFYGLARQSKKSSFTKREKYLSLLCLVLVPYLNSKLEKKMQQMKENLDRSSTSKAAVHSYRITKAIYEFSKIIQYILYLTKITKTHSVSLQLFQMSLKYAEPSDDETFSWTDLITGNFKSSTILSVFLFRGLELAGFFLQFLQFWQNQSTQSIASLPTPIAPQKDVNANKYLNICPMCLQGWKTPTAICISGYVFCYSCIVNHLVKERRCPVTNYPASLDDLVRIYDVDS